MATAYIRKGTKFKYKGRKYKLLKLYDNKIWHCKEMKTSQIFDIPDIDLRSYFSTGKAKFLLKSYLGKQSKKHSKGSLCRTEEDWRIAKDRLRYIKVIMDFPSNVEKIDRALQDFVDLNDDLDTPPSGRTVLRWRNTYIESGKDIESLMSRASNQGNRAKRYDNQVYEIVRKWLTKKYLTEHRPTLEAVRIKACAEIKKINEKRKHKNKRALLAEPSRRLITRLRDEIPAYDLYAARYGWVAAQNKFRSSGNQRHPEYCLQVAEIDHSILDFFVIDDETLYPLGRPWLTVCIDKYSRTILGIHIGFDPPSYLTVAACLKHAFLPKSSLKETYKSINNDWSPHGVMHELVIDNGMEFTGTSLENLCANLNIDVYQCPAKRPWFKGTVERFFGSLGKSFVVSFPGRTFGSIFERGDYDPEKHAVVRYSVMKEAIFKWVVDVYFQKNHSSLQAKPITIWKNNINPEDIPLPRSVEQVDAIMGRSEIRVLDHSGIRLDHLDYNSSEMVALRKQHGPKLEVEIRIDDSDIGEIKVICPFSNRTLTARCTQYEYVNGMSRFMHKTARRYAAELGLEDDVESWIIAADEIMESLDNEVAFKRKGKRIRTARIKESRKNAEMKKEKRKSKGKVDGTFTNVPSSSLLFDVELRDRGGRK